MSTVSNLIFHNAKHRMSSGFGPRKTISTAAGNSSTYHKGTDYATYSEKLPQYAIEDGEVLTATKAADGALYVWVSYPRLGVKLLHYHLDSIKVKEGQKVNKDTILGYTGKTGKATGVHLHLGVKRLSGGDFIDPEKWSKNEYKAPTEKKPTSSSKYSKGDYIVTASLLNVRSGPGTNYTKKTFKQLTENAQKQVRALAGYKANGYPKGVEFTALETKNNWARTPSGWVCLNYCKKI